MSVNASANVSVCVRWSVHGNVLVRTSLLRRLRSRSFPIITLPGRWWTAGGRGGQLAVRAVPGTSCGSWILMFACCHCQATATEAYIWANAVSWPPSWTLVSFFVTSAGLRVVNTMQAFYFTVSRPRHLCLLIIWDAAWLRVTTCRPIQFTYKFSATVIHNIRPNECINESPRAFKVLWRWCYTVYLWSTQMLQHKTHCTVKLQVFVYI